MAASTSAATTDARTSSDATQSYQDHVVHGYPAQEITRTADESRGDQGAFFTPMADGNRQAVSMGSARSSAAAAAIFPMGSPSESQLSSSLAGSHSPAVQRLAARLSRLSPIKDVPTPMSQPRHVVATNNVVTSARKTVLEQLPGSAMRGASGTVAESNPPTSEWRNVITGLTDTLRSMNLMASDAIEHQERTAQVMREELKATRELVVQALQFAPARVSKKKVLGDGGVLKPQQAWASERCEVISDTIKKQREAAKAAKASSNRSPAIARNCAPRCAIRRNCSRLRSMSC